MHHDPPRRHRHYGRSLTIAIAISGGMMAVELWAAWRTRSLALLSDAGHMLADLSGLVLAYFALRLASRPATPAASYGYQRYEVLAAGANGMLLLGLVLGLLWQAVARLQRPLDRLDTRLVLAVAVLGLAANLFAAWRLRDDASHNINARGALWNVLGDAVASLGVVLATLLVHFTGNTSWDTYVTFFVAAIIFVAAFQLLRQTGAILLESTPPGVDLGELKAAVEALPGVVNVHDLHAWTLTPGHHSLTMHVSIAQQETPRFHQITRDIEALLSERWGLDHCTIQVEPAGADPLSDQHDPLQPRRRLPPGH